MEVAVKQSYIKNVLENVPNDWLRLTTHRLDIYNEKLAKTQFLQELEKLASKTIYDTASLNKLPTAFDYIRLGHPLSCVLEWSIATDLSVPAEYVVSFSSKTTPILAILRKNLFEKKNTRLVSTGSFHESFDLEIVKRVYGYHFETEHINSINELRPYNGTTVFISNTENIWEFESTPFADFMLNTNEKFGSILLVNGAENLEYISEIQHVRRRETIAMTPADCYAALTLKSGSVLKSTVKNEISENKSQVFSQIKNITSTNSKPAVGSSGLSIQYAIMMGLIHDALENHPGKEIKVIVPPNCYGGTNDQARRVAACLPNVEVMDLPVDGGNDMVKSIDLALKEIADLDAVPFIIAEIPTNPRVEVPDLQGLKAALSQKRQTPSKELAVDPVFILDQTFCPNVHFLGENDTLSTVRVISYSSGSKFPSGGLCNAGYCVANSKGAGLMKKIHMHLELCDNEATDLQYEVLATQMPSMLQRIEDAYKNTREFVNHIKNVLPEAKINFVSEELAGLGFTPSVFSLDLPTKGDTEESREIFKRLLNNKLIEMVISEIPSESKNCVSYGQLKGCYWTIPATSTQGTTKDEDKDYIARVALSPEMDLEKHKEVFSKFVDEVITFL